MQHTAQLCTDVDTCWTYHLHEQKQQAPSSSRQGPCWGSGSCGSPPHTRRSAPRWPSSCNHWIANSAASLGCSQVPAYRDCLSLKPPKVWGTHQSLQAVYTYVRHGLTSEETLSTEHAWNTNPTCQCCAASSWKCLQVCGALTCACPPGSRASQRGAAGGTHAAPWCSSPLPQGTPYARGCTPRLHIALTWPTGVCACCILRWQRFMLTAHERSPARSAPLPRQAAAYALPQRLALAARKQAPATAEHHQRAQHQRNRQRPGDQHQQRGRLGAVHQAAEGEVHAGRLRGAGERAVLQHCLQHGLRKCVILQRLVQQHVKQ